jgi:hypothetical protein
MHTHTHAQKQIISAVSSAEGFAIRMGNGNVTANMNLLPKVKQDPGWSEFTTLTAVPWNLGNSNCSVEINKLATAQWNLRNS